jgi:site-specific DNA recombinase
MNKTKPGTSGRRCAIYIRVSSGGQEDGYSLETQDARCRAHAEALGLSVLEVFQDVHTGAEWRERPGLTQLRQAVRSGEIDVVLAFALDRLSRKQTHVAILADEFQHAGARLEFVTEDFENTAVGEFIRSAKAFAAEVEREKLAERTVRGRLARVQSGKLIPGGRPPYGYRWRDATKGQLEIDPITGPVARRIYESAAGGMSLYKIAKSLVEDGIPNPSGQRVWHNSTLSNLLHRPAYKGVAFGWGVRKAGVQPQTFDPEKAIRLPDGTIPALVDEPTWDAVQIVLQRNKAQSIRSAKNPEAALLRNGFVRCGSCGRVMKTRPRSGGGVDYYCGGSSNVLCARPTSIKGAILDTAVWTRVRGIIVDPSTVANELERLRHADPTGEELASVQRLIDDVNRQQANLARAIAMLEDPDASAPLIAQLASLSDRRKTLEHERDVVEERRASWFAAQANLENLEQWSKTIADRVDDLTWEQKRLALNALNVSAEVYPAGSQPRFVIKAEIEAQSVSTTT